MVFLGLPREYWYPVSSKPLLGGNLHCRGQVDGWRGGRVFTSAGILVHSWR